MIRDARVLKEHYVPREIIRRDQELNELERALGPVQDGEVAENAFLFGPSGVGKTAIARFMLHQLESEVLDVTTKYLNCWDEYTRYRVLYEVLDGFTSTVDVHRQSTATDELLHKVRQYDGPPYVVVLDEVDQLQDKEVLYSLYRVQNLSMIFISNEEAEFFAQLDERLESRLHAARRIRLPRYHLDELADILERRALYALIEGAISRENLEEISDRAAGDARIGIGILRSAAREAESEGMEEITLDIVDSVVDRARLEIHRKNLDQLRPDQRLIYDILVEHGKLQPSELYDVYQERADDPKTNRTVRNHLQKLQHYNLVEAEGEKRARTYKAREI